MTTVKSTTAISDYACVTYLLKCAVTVLTPVATCTWLVMQAQTRILKELISTGSPLFEAV